MKKIQTNYKGNSRRFAHCWGGRGIPLITTPPPTGGGSPSRSWKLVHPTNLPEEHPSLSHFWSFQVKIGLGECGFPIIHPKWLPPRRPKPFLVLIRWFKYSNFLWLVLVALLPVGVRLEGGYGCCREVRNVLLGWMPLFCLGHIHRKVGKLWIPWMK